MILTPKVRLLMAGICSGVLIYSALLHLALGDTKNAAIAAAFLLINVVSGVMAWNDIGKEDA